MEEILKIFLIMLFACLVFGIILVLAEVFPIVGYPLMSCTGFILLLAVIGFIASVTITACK